MGQTTNYNLPYPESTDPANVPADMRLLAETVEAKLEDIEETIEEGSEKNSITVNMLQSVSTYNWNTESIIPFNNVQTIVGNKLSLNNNGAIKIGSGVNHIKVSACIGGYCSSPETSGNKYIRGIIYKNSTPIYANRAGVINNYRPNIPIVGGIVSVEENDVIGVKVYANTTYNAQLETDVNYLTVEVID